MRTSLDAGIAIYSEAAPLWCVVILARCYPDQNHIHIFLFSKLKSCLEFFSVVAELSGI